MELRQRPRIRVLSEEQCRAVHAAALTTLAGTGILVEDDDTRQRLIDAGCRRGEGGHLCFAEKLISDALAGVPSRLVLYDRNGRAAADTDSAAPHFCPGLNCVDVLDHRSKELRPCTLGDVAAAARLCERLPNLDLATGLGNPADLPEHEQALATVLALIEHTAKPFPFIAHNELEAERIWTRLAEAAGGWQRLAEKPFAIDLTGPTSPLRIGEEACRRLRFAGRKGLPVVCYPALMPGINGPLTLAGALSQSAAEILAGIVIQQLERPGAPVLSGSAIVPFDMRTLRLAYGAPEYILACLAAADYFRSIGVPSWVGAGCTDAHTLDAQAASEAGANLLAAALSATSLVHNLGFLSSGKTGSLEMLVLCDELAGMCRRVAAGITVNEDTLAVDLTGRAGRHGRFLTEGRHTARHLRKEVWLPSILQRLSLGGWQEAGSPPLATRIRQKLEDLLG